MSEDELIGISNQESDITPEMVEDYLVWQALAKIASSNASKIKQELSLRLGAHPDNLDAITVGDIEIKREHTSVEWNPAIIRTIANIDGVSEQDKLKLFKLPSPPKANGVHLNAIAKKYKGSVAKRIEDAREESGLTIKINPNKVLQQVINDKAQNLIKNTVEIEGEL